MSALECGVDRPASLDAGFDEGRWLVRFTGELDLSTREDFEQACLRGGGAAVMVDLENASFMDCGGYSALMSARRHVVELGGSLEYRNHVGQPAHFLDLLSEFGLAS